ncbi:MAG: class I SAM-dependent methyltransferase [Anaerolineae bacterium]
MTQDNWAAGAAYEPYVGRWSRLVAQDFVKWLSIADNRSWLDVGCGTGALSQAILSAAAPRSLVGIDSSEGFLAHARQTIHDARVRFEVADAQVIPLDASSCDVAVSGLVLNFVPEPTLMLGEMARVVRQGGTIAVYVWDYAGEMQLMRHFWDAVVALDPSAKPRDEAIRFPICQPEPLTKLFQDVRLADIRLLPITVSTHFHDFDDYWNPFLSGQGPAPTYVTSLDDSHRNTLRDYIHEQLPVQDDGTIPLSARAWAVRATRS